MFKWFHSDDLGKLLLRVTIGLLMLFHGFDKIIHFDSVKTISASLLAGGFPSYLAYGIYIGEVVAPIMIVAGFFTRFAALTLAGTMAFGLYLVHSGSIFTLTNHGGWGLELPMLFCAGGFAIMLLGSGRYAVKPD